MRVPMIRAALTFQQHRLEGAQIDKATGRSIIAASQKDIAHQIDSRHDELRRQANETHDAAEKGSWITKIAVTAAAVGTFSAAASFAVGVSGGMFGISTAINVVTMAAIPVVVNSLLVAVIAKGIGSLVTKGDRDDANQAQANAGQADLQIKGDHQTLDRSGLANLDRARTEARDSYKAILKMTTQQN